MAATEALSGLGFFQGFGEGRHDLENVADDAVVGNFEDGGVRIFVDGDDGAGALHADDVLNRAADSQGQIEFRRDGLAGAADLALHGEPAFVANGTRCGDFTTQRFRERYGLWNILGRLDAAADGNYERRLRQVHGGFRFLEEIERLGANLRRAQRYGHGIYGRFSRGMRSKQISTKRSRLKRGEPRRSSGKRDIRRGFALEHLTHENELATLVAVTNAVADHALAEHGCELRREVAHLVGVGEQNQIRLGTFHYLFQRDAIAVRRVRFEQVMFDGQDFGDIFRRQLVRECDNTFSDHQRAHCTGSIFGDLLGGCQCLETGIVPLALPQFGYN